MKKKVLFIVNPKSGKGIIRNHLLDIIDVFTKASFDLGIYISQSAGDARKKTKEAAERYDLIICSGGDGTLDEVISGVMECEKEKRPCIGYLPCGSTNDFANSVGIPKTLPVAAQHVAEWKEFPCDIGLFNDDFFVYIAAFGLFTDVSYETNQDMKNVLGHLAYVLEGMIKLMDIKSYRLNIEANGTCIDGEFIYGMVTNSTSVGGFKNITGKNVKLDDGLFEVTLIRKPHDILEMNEIIQAVISGKPDDKYFYQFRTEKISFKSEKEIPWTLDGEFGGYHTDVEIENAKHALTLLI